MNSVGVDLVLFMSLTLLLHATDVSANAAPTAKDEYLDKNHQKALVAYYYERRKYYAAQPKPGRDRANFSPEYRAWADAYNRCSSDCVSACWKKSSFWFKLFCYSSCDTFCDRILPDPPIPL